MKPSPPLITESILAVSSTPTKITSTADVSYMNRALMTVHL
jgi:hypothetical protein